MNPRSFTSAKLLQMVVVLLLPVALLRFFAAGLVPAIRGLSGDFAAVFPTEYFAKFRPDFPTSQVWDGWYYGPMLHFVTAPLLMLPEWWMIPPAWALVNCAALLTSFLCVMKLAGNEFADWQSRLLLPVLWLLYQPLVNSLAQGSIEILEGALVLAALVWLRRAGGTWSGILIGVATMIKFLPIGFMAWMAVRGMWRATAWAAATLAFVAMVASGTLGWRNAVTVDNVRWSASNHLAGTQELSVTSLFLHRTSRLLHESGDRHVTPAWFPTTRASTALRAGWIASILIAAACGFVLWRRRCRPASANEVGILFMAMFMLLPWNHDYYYIFAIGPISILVAAALRERRLGLLTLALLGYVLISPPIPYSWIDAVGWLPIPAADAINFAGLPVLGALLVWGGLLSRLLSEPPDLRAPSRGSGLRSRRWLIAGVAAAFAGGAGLVTATPAAPTRSTSETSVRLRLEAGPPLAISRDGSQVAFVSGSPQIGRVCLTKIGAVDANCLDGTAGGTAPFFAPDGGWVGFFSGSSLMKVAVDGLGLTVIAQIPGARTGFWANDGSILVATEGRGIVRVSRAGRMEVLIPQLAGQGDYSWPVMLPGGRTVLFAVSPPGSSLGSGQLVAFSLDTGRRKSLFAGTQPWFDEASRTLSYTLNRRVLRVKFDPDRLVASGLSVPRTLPVLSTSQAGPIVAYDGIGGVAYVAGEGAIEERELVWVSRDGRQDPILGLREAFRRPRISPDGRDVLVSLDSLTSDLWRVNIATAAIKRVTYTSSANDSAVWKPDGGFFFSARLESADKSALFVAPAAGTELSASRLWTGGGPLYLGGWSKTGSMLVGVQSGDLWMLRLPTVPTGTVLQGGHERVIVTQTAAQEADVSMSPDGKWLAYSSDQTGRREVFIQAVEPLGKPIQVSREGGVEPVWSPAGQDLFFRAGSEVLLVRLSGGAVKSVPRRLFAGEFLTGGMGANYDVARDGQRLLMVRPVPKGQAPVTVRFSRD